MIRKIGADAEKAVEKAIAATGLEIITGVKKRIQRGPKTGKTYTRGNIAHVASAPGEAPATDTGTLASSPYFEQNGKLSVTVGSRLAYAAYLEFGTTKIAPRPSWTPETELARPKMKSRIEKALAQVVK